MVVSTQLPETAMKMDAKTTKVARGKRSVGLQPVSFCAMFFLILVAACGTKSTNAGPTSSSFPINTVWPLSDAQVNNLLSERIFFGHQSVGDNIVQGIRDEIAVDSRLRLNIIHSGSPQKIKGPAFIESYIGRNTDPSSKDAAFAAIINNGFGSKGGIAMYKYCFVDITEATDVQRVFQNYRNEINALKAKFPALRIVHITAPLTVDPIVQRNDFNNLLRQYYGAEPIFDLAEEESTHPDGSRSYVDVGGQRIYTLAAEYSSDGGHLNDLGRRAAAQRMLIVLANI